MFSPVHHDLEGLAAERFRSLAGQLRRLQQHVAPAERLDALCRDEIRWAAAAPGLNGCLRYLASQAHLQEIHFLWRPFLPDADDDMVLELAFAAGCGYIVTHNVHDFHGSEQLGVNAIPPRDFLNLTRMKP